MNFYTYIKFTVSRSPPVVYDEIIEDDITKDVDKPEDTQSPSKSPSVHSETIVDAINTKPSNINMTTPENNRTSAKTKLASIRRSQNIEPHQTSSSSSWQNDNLPERMPYQSWSHKYYDLQDPFHLPPDLPIDKPAIIHSDRLFDDEHEMIFARESSTESVLPSPSTSLDSTISEESFEKSLPEKKQQGFFGNFCSIM
uniref:Uncharacterized protein n=1 Tax=Panagrolaimus superbus TaxID=310955 RepID=A0A914YJ36_9BILA